MTQRSIGQFLAALRKANGMTQRQLAEKLNVSDKAVSRWERDECAPDLSLIPVLAEIYDITSDEILRGERATVRADDSVQPTTKSKKQMERLLRDTSIKFGIRTALSLGLCIVGLLAAMICNFGFNRAYLGFLLGCVFFLASFITQAVFGVLAYSAVKSSEFEESSVNRTKGRILHISVAVLLAPLVCAVFCLPLVTLPWDTYMGITLSWWFNVGSFYGVIAVTAGAFLWLVADSVALRLGIFACSKNISAQKKSRLMIVSVVMTVTLCLQVAFNVMCSPITFASGQVFTDMQAFKQFMETPTIGSDSSVTVYPTESIDVGSGEGLTAITAPNGSIVVEYDDRNESVTRTHVEWEGNIPTITVWTAEDITAGAAVISRLNDAFVLLYPLELILITLIYRERKRRHM